jgi:hypothetical protein
MLELFNIDESQLQFFENGRPLHPDELGALYRLLFRMPQFAIEDLERWSRHDVSWAELAAHPDAYRGEVFRALGKVIDIQLEPMLPELVTRFRFDDYCRVTIQLADTPATAVVLARTIPQAWRNALEQGLPIEEPAGALGIFLKAGQSGDETPQLVFVADRVGWYPSQAGSALKIEADQAFLGRLGMDWGLFDQVRHRREFSSSDRECFYQLLSVVARTDPAELIQRSRPGYDMQQLLTEPESEEGRLYLLEGTARRATRIRVDDPDIQRRFGIDHYFEIEVFVPLDQTIRFVEGPEDAEGKVFTDYPIVFCVRRLPPGLPEGDNIREWVRVAGSYFKLWAYRTQFMSEGAPTSNDRTAGLRRQVSPLLVGLEPQWIPTEGPRSPGGGVVLGAVFVAVVVGIWAAVWWFHREDVRFERTTLDRQLAPDHPPGLDRLAAVEPEPPPDSPPSG